MPANPEGHRRLEVDAIAATRVVSPKRLEGELNLIFERAAWPPRRQEVAIVSVPPEENGVRLSERDVEELQQQVKWFVEHAVSGEELTVFNKSGRDLRLEVTANDPIITQLMGRHRASFEWVAATTQWPSLKSDLQARLAALARQSSPTSPFH
jgi:hypothetical protein